MKKLVIVPASIAIVLGIIGVLAVRLQQPWLAPSLGSIIFTQTMTPDQPSARLWNVGAGQLLGAVGGFAGVYVAQATPTPLFFGDHPLVYARALAVVIAVLVAAALQLALKAPTPGGGATAVIVAVGAETANWAGFTHLAVGIALVTLLGEMARRAVLRAG